MSRHTPGPWTFRPNPCECNDCTASHWIDGPPDAPGATLGKPIAEVREYHKGESEANARLIAAAPELADALAAVLDDVVGECRFIAGHPWNGRCEAHDTIEQKPGECAVQHAREVLQRARGAS